MNTLTTHKKTNWFISLLLLLCCSSVFLSSHTFAKDTVTYYHNDLLGNPVAATNEKGDVIWRKHYDPHGNVVAIDGDTVEAKAERKGYTGHTKDNSTGLVYMGARYYNPKIGVFYAYDPAPVTPNNPFSFSRYAYANQNPYKFVDPDGRLPILAAIPWLIGVISAGATGYEIGSAGYGLYSGDISASDLAGDVGQEIAINTALKAVPGGAAVAISRKISKAINPDTIRFSQSSVNGADELTQSMRKNGWKGSPIDVVKMSDGGLTAIDNTRVLAASRAGVNVQANVRNANDALPKNMVERFTTKNGVPSTWGEAVNLRIGKQKSQFRNKYPQGSPYTGAK